MRGLTTLTVFTFLTAITAKSMPSPVTLSPRSAHQNVIPFHANYRMIKRSLSKRCKSKSGLGHGGDDDDDSSSKSKKKPKSKSSGEEDDDSDPSTGGNGKAFSIKQLTFYGDSSEPDQLKNPACFDGWNPDASEVFGIAVSQNWGSGSKPQCGDYLEISYSGKKVLGRVIDQCAGDGCDGKALDLTPNCFKALAAFSVGVLHDATAQVVDAPSEWSEAKYGPKSVHKRL